MKPDGLGVEDRAMKRALAILLAIVSLSIVDYSSVGWAQNSLAFTPHNSICARLHRCINTCAITYNSCRNPGPFVTPERVCAKALLACTPQCHAQFGYCPG